MNPTSSKQRSPALDIPIHKDDFFECLPKAMILEVLGWLTPSELAQCSRVSRSWKQLADHPSLWKAFDLEKLFPSLKIFDASNWTARVNLPAYGLSVAGEPLLDNRKMIPILKESFLSVPVQKNAGFTLLTIPHGITFQNVQELPKNPKKIEGKEYTKESNTQTVSGDSSVNGTYRILITRGALGVTGDFSAMQNKEFLQKNGWEIPKTIEAAAFFATALISFDRAIRGGNARTTTYCSDELNGLRYEVGISRNSVALGQTPYKGEISFDVAICVLGVLRQLPRI